MTQVQSNDIVIDDHLSTDSENPVQNKVITNEINRKAYKSSLGTQVDYLLNGKTLIITEKTTEVDE